MRETVRSLRLYFGFFGVVGALGLAVSGPFADMGYGVLPWLFDLALTVTLLFLAVRLEELLRHRPQIVLGFILLSGGLSIAAGLIEAIEIARLGGSASRHVAIHMGIPALITWYLYVNARRLARALNPGPRVASAFD